MKRCPRCKIGVLSQCSCIKCGFKSQVDRPQVTITEKQQEKQPEIPKVVERQHGFDRLAAELNDPEMTAICEQGRVIPLDHPMERAAEMVADSIAFVRTPGGKTVFSAIKKGLANIFGE
jgi:hypothetical protein